MKLFSRITIGALCVLSGVVGQVAFAHVAVDEDHLGPLGLTEGDIVGSSEGDPDIYIVNQFGYKRLFLSPTIFSFYGHLRFDQVKRFQTTVIDAMPISALFRNCEANDKRVYALEVTGEDGAALRWVNISGEAAVAEDAQFFKKIFCINAREFASYPKGVAYTALAQVPVYKRSALPTPGANTTSLPLQVPSGYRISLFTPQKVGPLRMMAVSPDGILFVSMPSASGLYGGSALSNGSVFALPDRNGDGVADETKRVLTGLRMPHGLAFFSGYLYVAEEGAVARYAYTNGGTLGARQVVVSNLPTGGEHISRSIAFSSAGKMYIAVGSSCNNCSPGQAGTAAIWEYNADGTGGRIYATGLRNAVGLAFHENGELWTTENSRDYLGDDLPPDEINSVRDGGNYGWPRCYGRQVIDSAYTDTGFCQATQPSIHTMQAHSAPLGLTFVRSSQFSSWIGDVLVARHGSWNRKQPVGYDVIRLDVEGNAIVGESPFITGWLTDKNVKMGRPVDVIFGHDGALYISDDMANVIYRVTKLP
jgi:glucose/arabinose dehydrogenase